MLRNFVKDHPQGWGHEEWLGLLADISARGLTPVDGDEIGRMVEKERLALVLGRIEKVGPQRIKTITDKFETVWVLRAADVESLAEATKIPRALAERIKESV